MANTLKAFWAALCAGTKRDRRNEYRIVVWMFGWMLSWLAVGAAIKYGWLDIGLPAVILILITTVFGLGMILAFRRFLREADELRRKIELDALALALGVGLVGGLTYWLLERSGAVAEVDILNLVVLMIFSYGAGVLRGFWSYA